MTERTCSIEGCHQRHYARGWCNKHYSRWWLHGDPLYTRRIAESAEAFWSRVDRDGPVSAYRPDLGPCWIWTGGLTEKGYANVWRSNRQCLGHRIAYELAHGPEFGPLDHLCRVRHCVNPAHLEPCSLGENVLRGQGISAVNKRKTHCKRGHPFDEANTAIYNGCRRCRKCSADRSAGRI